MLDISEREYTIMRLKGSKFEPIKLKTPDKPKHQPLVKKVESAPKPDSIERIARALEESVKNTENITKLQMQGMVDAMKIMADMASKQTVAAPPAKPVVEILNTPVEVKETVKHVEPLVIKTDEYQFNVIRGHDGLIHAVESDDYIFQVKRGDGDLMNEITTNGVSFTFVRGGKGDIEHIISKMGKPRL